MRAAPWLWLSLLLWGCAGSGAAGPEALPQVSQLGTPGQIWGAWLRGEPREEAHAAFGVHLEEPVGLLGRAHTAWLRGDQAEAFARCGELLAAHPGHALARWAAACLEDLRGAVPDGLQRAAAAVEKAGVPRIIDPAAAVIAARLRLEARAAQHEREDQDQPFDGAAWGQPARWRVLGLPGDASPRGRSPDAHDLLPDALEHQGRLRVTRAQHLGQPRQRLPDPSPGVWYAEQTFSVARAGPWLLLLDLPAGARAWLDGEELDPRGAQTARTRLARVELTQGRHRLRLRLTQGDGAPLSWQALWAPRREGDALQDQPSPQGAARVAQLGGWELGLPLRAASAQEDPLAAWLLAAWRARAEPPELGLDTLTQYAREAPRFAGAQALLALRAQNLREAGHLPPYTGRRVAVEGWRRAVALDPGALLAARALGWALVERGDWRQGVELLRAQAQEQPEALEVWRWLAEAWQRRGWRAEALEALARARALDPGDCGLAEAQVALDPSALEAESQGPCLAIRARWLRQLAAQGEYAEPEAALRRALARGPEDGERHRALAALLTQAGRAEEAALVLERRLGAQPADVASRRQLADLRVAQGRPEEALRVVQSGGEEAEASLVQLEAWLRGALPLQELREPTARWLRRAPPQGEAQFLLDYQAVKRLEGGRRWRLIHQLIQINSAEGATRGALAAPPAQAILLNLRAWRGGEVEVALWRGEGVLRGLQAGDVLELEYLLAEPHDLEEAPARHRFGAPGSWTQASLLRVAWRGDQAPRVAVEGPRAPLIERLDEGDAHRLTLRLDTILAAEAEPLGPSPLVTATISQGDPLERLRVARAAQAARATAPTAALRRQALALRPDHPDPEGWLRALFDWTTAQVEDSDPQDWETGAEEVWRRRAGAPHLLLAALARAADLPVELVLLRPQLATEGAADPEAWSAVALRVEVHGEARWLDPTLRWMPFHYLPPALQGAEGLVVAPWRAGGAARRQSPTFDPALERREITQTLHIQPDGSLRGEVRVELHGHTAALLRERLTGARDEQALIGAIAAAEFPGHQLLRWELRQAQARGLPLGVSFRFVQDPHARPSPGGAWVSQTTLASHHLEALLAPLPARESALLLAQPRRTTLRTTFLPPEGWEVRSPLEDLRARAARGGFTRVVTRLGARLVVEDELDLPAQRIEPEDYESFRAFTQQVDEAARVTLTVSRLE